MNDDLHWSRTFQMVYITWKLSLNQAISLLREVFILEFAEFEIDHIYIGSTDDECVVPESIHAPSMEGHPKFLGAGGILKAKLLEEKYETKLEFPGGVRRCKTKKPSVGGVWTFTGTTQ